MSTIAARAYATGAYRCKVLDFEGNCIRVVHVNKADLAAKRIEVRNAGYRLVPYAEVSERYEDIANTSRYGREA